MIELAAQAEADQVTLAEVLMAALPAGAVLLVVLIERRYQHGREVRDMRRVAYVEWLVAARNLGSWTGPTPAAGQVKMPHPQRKQRLNDLTAALELLASPRVTRAARDFIAQLVSPEFQRLLTGSFSDMDEVTDRIDAFMKPYRKKVIAAMKRDMRLSSWWGRWRKKTDDQLDDQDNELTTTITDDGGQEQASDQGQQTTGEPRAGLLRSHHLTIDERRSLPSGSLLEDRVVLLKPLRAARIIHKYGGGRPMGGQGATERFERQ